MTNSVGAHFMRSGRSAGELGIHGGKWLCLRLAQTKSLRGVLVNSSSANLPLEGTFANSLEDTVKTRILRGGCVKFDE